MDEADTASGTCTVTVVDAMGYGSSTVFTVTRDVTSPTLTLEALVQGSDVPVTWSATAPSTGGSTGSPPSSGQAGSGWRCRCFPGYRPLMRSSAITEIMVNGPYIIFIEQDGKIRETGRKFLDDDHVERIVKP